MCNRCKDENEFYKEAWDEELLDNEELLDIENDDFYPIMGKEINKRLRAQQNDIIQSWLVWTVYNALGNDLLDRIKAGEETKEDREKLRKYIAWQAIKKMDRVMDESFRNMFFWYLLYVATKWGASIFNQIGLEKEFTINSPVFKKEILDRVIFLGNSLDNTTANKFADNIIIGIKEWLWIDRLNKELKAIGKEIAIDRRDMIMENETNNMLQFSRNKVANVTWAAYKIWHATEDERTCKIWMDLDGSVADISDGFPWVEVGDLVHIACRCWIEFVYEGDIDLNSLEDISF